MKAVPRLAGFPPLFSDRYSMLQPAGLPTEPGAYIKLEIRAVQPEHPAWGTPVAAYFRRAGGGRLVGLDRIP